MVVEMPHHTPNGGPVDSRGEVARLHDELDALHATAVALALSDRADPDGLLERIVEHAANLVDGSIGYVYLVDEEEGMLVQRVGQGSFARFVYTRVGPGTGVGGRVWASGHADRYARRALG